MNVHIDGLDILDWKARAEAAEAKLRDVGTLHALSPVPNGKGVTGEWCICGHVNCKERAILERGGEA